MPKISPARESARSCFEYDIRPKHGRPRGEWIAGSLRGTPRQMARMAGAYRALRPDCKKPVWRCSLSLPPSDGRPSAQKWAQIAEDFLAEMEVPAAAAWVAVHHGEVDHDHIHITLLRTLPDGTLWNEERSAKRAIKACAVLEARHQLASHDRTPKPKNAPSRAEIEIFARQQKKGKPVMSREYIQSAVDQILADYPPPKGIDFIDLQRLLADMKPPIDLQASMPKGIFRGVSYQFDSFKWPGSKIGREYSVGLVERGVRMPTAKTGVTQPPEVADPFLSQADRPVSPAPDQYTRAPASIRPLLRQQEQARQDRQDRQLRREMAAVPTLNPEPAQPSKRWEVDLSAVDQATRDLGPLTRAMALLGAVAVKYSLAFLRGLIAWLGRLLAKLGFGIREAPQQVASGQQAVTYSPYTIDAEARQVNAVDAAAQLVTQVAAALDEKNAAWLPRGEGRDAIAAGLMADAGRESEPVAVVAEVAEVAVPDALDDMFKLEVADAAAASAPTAPAAAPAAPVKSAWFQFSEAAKAYALAAAAVQQARLKPIFYIDGRPKARVLHQAATAELAELEKALSGWRADHKVAAALGADPLGLKAQAEAARTAAARTAAGLLKADQEHAEFEILFAKTPAPTVPMALQDRYTAAAAALNRANQLLISKARLNLTILDGNPMLRQLREALAAQVRRAETRLAAFIADPRSQPKAVGELEETLRSLAAEVNVERARLAPRPDIEDGQNVDEAGQRGHAVPGQR